MRQICYNFILCFLLQTVNAQIQTNKSPTLWKLFISAGYANTKSSVVNDYYEGILNSYRSAGVPIISQTPFGRTVVINGGFLFTRLESMWIGFSAGYSYSPAFSNYKDYAGTIKVNGSFHYFEFSTKFVSTVEAIGNFPINVTFQPG